MLRPLQMAHAFLAEVVTKEDTVRPLSRVPLPALRSALRAESFAVRADLVQTDL